MLKNITYISAAKNKKKEKKSSGGQNFMENLPDGWIILLFLLGVTAGTFFINTSVKADMKN